MNMRLLVAMAPWLLVGFVVWCFRYERRRKVQQHEWYSLAPESRNYTVIRQHCWKCGGFRWISTNESSIEPETECSGALTDEA